MSRDGYPPGIHLPVCFEIVECPAEPPGPGGDRSPLVRRRARLSFFVKERLDTIFETVIIIGVDIAVIGCHQRKTTVDVISHHGIPEFGAVKVPATPEAYMVHYIDNLDAKLNQVSSAIESEPSDSNWTAWQGALQTKLYRKRLE